MRQLRTALLLEQPMQAPQIQRKRMLRWLQAFEGQIKQLIIQYERVVRLLGRVAPNTGAGLLKYNVMMWFYPFIFQAPLQIPAIKP